MRAVGALGERTLRVPERAPRTASAAPARAPAVARDAVDLGLPKPDADLVHRALGSGEVRFRNDQGGEARLAVAQADAGHFTLTLDGRPVDVRIAAGLPEAEALARIADYLSQHPPHMREGLKRIEVSTSKKDDAAATAYNGDRIVFWQGMDYLRPSTFFHEMGHINAKRVYGHTDPADAWDHAQAQDGKTITEYAKTNDNEDFAEMMEAYWLARRGEGEHTLDELRRRFLARMAIIEAIVAGRPVDTRDADYWRIGGFDIPRLATVWREIDGPRLLDRARGLFGRLLPGT